MAEIPAPDCLAEHGAKLWDALTARYEFEEHELVTVREICVCEDTLWRLRRGLARSAATRKVYIDYQHGQQRLIAALRLPVETPAGMSRPHGRSAARGAYKSLHAVSDAGV